MKFGVEENKNGWGYDRKSRAFEKALLKSDIPELSHSKDLFLCHCNKQFGVVDTTERYSETGDADNTKQEKITPSRRTLRLNQAVYKYIAPILALLFEGRSDPQRSAAW